MTEKNEAEIKKIKGELIKDFLKIGVLKQGDFVLTSGKKSSYYINLRILPSHPQIFRKLGELLTRYILTYIDSFDVIAGIATASIPLATLISITLNKPMIYVRKGKRKHGEKKTVEGKLRKNQKVLLIDDVLTTGESKAYAAQEIKKEGGKIKDMLIVVDRGEGGKERLKKDGYNVHCIFSVKEMFQH